MSDRGDGSRGSAGQTHGASAAGAVALSRYLQTKAQVDGPGLFLPPGQRDVLLARLRSLGTAGPSRAREAATDADPGVDVRSLSTCGTVAEIEALEDLDAVRAVALGCVRCRLHETRKSVVFAEGSPDARVLCVGEAPGAREDESGVPFVGRAGKLLDRLLLSVGLSREDVYICNVLKCRPPQNRNPQEDEIERCSPYLRRQVALVEPEVVIAFGTFAARTLLGARDTLGRLRGRTHSYEGVPLVVTYHPAALLRNPKWTRLTWEDLQRVRRVLQEGAHG